MDYAKVAAEIKAEFDEAESKNPTCEVCGKPMSEDKVSCRIQVGQYSAGRFYAGGQELPAHYECLWTT